MADDVKSIFDTDEFKPLKAEFERRRRHYGAAWKYYKGEYAARDARFSSAPGKYVSQLIQNSIKPLFTPIGRAVRIDVALVPGDWHLAPEATPLQDELEYLFYDSNWDVEGDMFVKFGVACGEVGLRIVHDLSRNPAPRTYLRPVRPDTYVTVPAGFYDPTPAMAVFVYSQHDDEGKDVEVAEVLEPTRIRTFRNGRPDGIDGRPAQYPNPLGYVPLVVAMFDDGEGWGEPTFDDAIASLDQVNRQATYMAQMIERHAEPQWAAFGAEAGELEKDGDSVWFFPEGSDIKAILAAVDFAGLLAFIKELKEEMKETLPELAFAQLVGVNRVAAATIELQMAEAVFKIRQLRKPLDNALARACQLAGAANPVLGQLNTADLRFDKNRPVITIDALTRLQIEQAQQTNELTRMTMERELMLAAAGSGEEMTDAE